MKKILVTRKLLQSNEDRLKDLYDVKLNSNVLASLKYEHSQIALSNHHSMLLTSTNPLLVRLNLSNLLCKLMLEKY